MHERICVPNKLNLDTLNRFAHDIDAVLAKTDCSVVVLTGGARYFCLGMDLQAVLTGDNAALVSTFTQVLQQISGSRKPVIALVEGDVIAGGLALMSLADMVIASDTATFCLPEVTFGLTPTLAICCLSERMRPQQLKQLLWQQQGISATQALAWGMVEQVAPAQHLEATLQTVLRKLTRLPSEVVTETQQHLTPDVGFSERLDFCGQRLLAQLQQPHQQVRIARFLADIALFNDEYAED